MLNRGHPFDSPSAVSLRLLFDDNDGPVPPLRIRENLGVARKEFLKALLLVVDAEPKDFCHLRGCLNSLRPLGTPVGVACGDNEVWLVPRDEIRRPVISANVSVTFAHQCRCNISHSGWFHSLIFA